MRNGSIEYLRFVGALGIVWFHMHLPYDFIALAALPMFVILLVYFGAGAKPLAHRARRLLFPWVFWSAVFICAKVAQALVSNQPILSEFHWWMFLTGTSLHLWFLPFCFVFLIATQSIPRKHVVYWLGAVSALSMLLFINFRTGIPFEQWLAVMPAAFLGLYLHQNTENKTIGLALSLSLAALAFVLWNATIFQTALALASFLLVMQVRLPSNAVSKWMSDISFGIYLVHPLMIALLLEATDVPLGIGYILVVIGSIVATMVVKRAVYSAV